MTVHERHRLADALDDLSERALAPAVMLGDSHYGSSDNMALTAAEHQSRGARTTAERRRLGTVDVAERFHSQRRSLGLALLTSNRFQLRSPKPCRPVSIASAKNVPIYCDVPCRRPSVTVPAFNIPRPGLTKSAGFIKAMAATSTDGGPHRSDHVA